MTVRIVNLACLLLLLMVISGCQTAGKSCLTGGCYGPFEITIKTEKGEKVEDVIVRLAWVTSSTYSEGGGERTYFEIAIGDTDTKIGFPRGFVYRTDRETLSLSVSISHPDYHSLAMSARFPNKQGPIDLGTKYMRHKQDQLDATIPEYEEGWRQAGLSEEEIEKKYAGLRLWRPSDRLGASTDYFARAVAIGREDIVDRYLPTWLQEDVNYRASTGKPYELSYQELYQLYYDAIIEKANRYAK